ncbi:hypothetical protein [Clostridium akagii]|uniref:hypothetical protein n=1 Tax=Clostridium akagii TaxID=91623 RepID=UPI00047C879C|nr:hypothetical protein [Clostridium akagii]
MEIVKSSNSIKMKSIQKFYLCALMAFVFTAITVISGATNVHADTWSVTLPAAKFTASENGYYCTNSNSGRISLTRIVNGPSYDVAAQMVNSNGEPRTNEVDVHQGSGYKNFPNSSMSYSYYYNLIVLNQTFEVSSRSAYGYIDINSTN